MNDQFRSVTNVGIGSRLVESIKGGAVPIQEVRISDACVLELVHCGWVDLSKGRIKSTLDFPAPFFEIILLVAC